MNDFRASFESEAYTPDGLVLGGDILSEVGTVEETEDVVRGELMGKVTKGAATATPDLGNTGDGLMGAIALGTYAKVGDYSLVCTQGSGSVLGSPSVVAGSNTGDGTIPSATAGAAAQAGDYLVTCTSPAEGAAVFSVMTPQGERLADAVEAVAYDNDHLAFTIGDCSSSEFVEGDSFTITVPADDANSGRFAVTDPEGYRLPDLTVGAAYDNGHLAMTLADGDDDFIAGDSITITVAEGSGVWKASLAAATDGSQEPRGVMAEDCDATEGAASALIYTGGDFAGASLTLGAGHTLASIKEGLKGRGIIIKDVAA